MSAERSKVSLNPSRPLRAFPREGTIIDESPALTAVLQAQPGRIVPGSDAPRVGTDGVRPGAGEPKTRHPKGLSAYDYGKVLRRQRQPNFARRTGPRWLKEAGRGPEIALDSRAKRPG